MLNEKMDLDVELKANNDSERQAEDMVLNAKMKMWLWTPKWRCGSERQPKKRYDGYECCTKKK